MQAENTQEIPMARPSGDGRFLYRFRGRDYLLTRERLLRQGKLARTWMIVLVGFGAVFVLSLFLVADLGAPWLIVPKAGFLVLALVWLLGFYWRTGALLEGCDHREVPKAKGMAARGAQWLEYNRSLYLRNNPRPESLFLFGMGSVGMFVLSVSGLWSRFPKLGGLEFAVESLYCLAISILSLGLAAVSFYALYRTLARDRAKPPGPDRPPNN
jgi:hypothetical protein